jgi:hypothetical protein
MKRVSKQNRISAFLNEIKLTQIFLTYGEHPLTTNGFDPSTREFYYKINKDYIGYFHNVGDNVQRSYKYTGLYAMGFSDAHGSVVTKENLTRCAIVFSVRKSILPLLKEQNLLWVRDKDVFCAPSKNLQNSNIWQEFETDCLVYSCFASGSNQTSLRNFEYNKKMYRINNQFFFFSKDFIKALAIENNNLEVQNDLLNQKNRIVYELLQKKEISKSSKDLLESAQKIYQKSFKYRAKYTKHFPKYNLNSWDSGFLQIYKMCFGKKDYFLQAKDDKDLQELYTEFKVKLRTLGDKILNVAQKDGII